MRDVRLFFPVVRRGGELIADHLDVVPLRLGDALRSRVREIVERPARVGLLPPVRRDGDPIWREVRRHHHDEFGFRSKPRAPHDSRSTYALSFGIAEVVAEALFAPVYGLLLALDDRAARIAKLSAPADRDPWAPRTKRLSS